MRVEALRTENGFLIPANKVLENIRQERILLEIEIIRQDEDELDQFFDRYAFDMRDFKFSREEANER